MSAPVDEIDVGHDPRRRAPWHDWSPGRRRAVAVAVVVAVLVAAGVWWALRPSDPAPVAAPPPVAEAPGADVVQDLGLATDRCPATAHTCRYGNQVTEAGEAAFRAAFASAGYIGRQAVVDGESGQVYWQFTRFTTGTLVTVTLSQQPVALLARPPVADDTPSDADRRDGSVDLTAVRDGYLMTATAAALPGQQLPVRAMQQWLRSVPAP